LLRRGRLEHRHAVDRVGRRARAKILALDRVAIERANGLVATWTEVGRIDDARRALARGVASVTSEPASGPRHARRAAVEVGVCQSAVGRSRGLPEVAVVDVAKATEASGIGVLVPRPNRNGAGVAWGAKVARKQRSARAITKRAGCAWEGRNSTGKSPAIWRIADVVSDVEGVGALGVEAAVAVWPSRMQHRRDRAIRPKNREVAVKKTGALATFGQTARDEMLPCLLAGVDASSLEIRVVEQVRAWCERARETLVVDDSLRALAALLPARGAEVVKRRAATQANLQIGVGLKVRRFVKAEAVRPCRREGGRCITGEARSGWRVHWRHLEAANWKRRVGDWRVHAKTTGIHAALIQAIKRGIVGATKLLGALRVLTARPNDVVIDLTAKV
jgi:hypothetical protein